MAEDFAARLEETLPDLAELALDIVSKPHWLEYVEHVLGKFSSWTQQTRNIYQRPLAAQVRAVLLREKAQGDPESVRQDTGFVSSDAEAQAAAEAKATATETRRRAASIPSVTAVGSPAQAAKVLSPTSKLREN